MGSSTVPISRVSRCLAAACSPWSAWLLPLASVYALVARRRRRRGEARAVRLPVPVISVGNLTAGGTGKTPVVEMVVRELIERGRRPAILSRGYRRYADDVSGRALNDEYRVLNENLPDVPHYQDPSRVTTGRRAIGEGADVLVLDDGFQHVALARDLDIVLVDAVNPFGGGHVLPAGLLREPLDTLGRADVVAITRGRNVNAQKLSILKTFLRWRFPGMPRVDVDFDPRGWARVDEEGFEPLARHHGMPVVAFAGIGNPEGFRRDLEILGVDVRDWISFADHHRYTRADVERVAASARRHGARSIVLTQKDAVKVRPLVTSSGLPWWYLKIRATVTGGAPTWSRLLGGALETGTPAPASPPPEAS